MPAIIYKNSLGKRVPSVTTVLSQWGIKTEPLKWWAYKMGQEGKDLREKPEANIGTIAHYLIDCDIKNKEPDLSQYPMELIEPARKCFISFQEWKSRHNFKPIESEISLVSEIYQFGGTLDCIALIDGRLSIPDWKTGQEIYEDHVLQVVAYQMLWDENFPKDKINGGYHILRIGKEIVSFDYKWFQEFPDAWTAFLHLRDLYDLHKRIKKLK